MNYTSAIYNYLTILTKQVKLKGITAKGSHRKVGDVNNPLITISSEELLLLGTHQLQGNLLIKSQNQDFSIQHKFDDFIKALSPNIVRLNHLGIRYSCKSIQSEVLYYKELLKNSLYHLYEENSLGYDSSWFFIGDTKHWESPMLEIVLDEYGKGYSDMWVPHFQIDLDTDLGIENLEELTNKYLANDFFNVKIDIPNYGVVVGMGMLENIKGQKIYLGLGTKIRGTKYHRARLLKEVQIKTNF